MRTKKRPKILNKMSTIDAWPQLAKQSSKISIEQETAYDRYHRTSTKHMNFQLLELRTETEILRNLKWGDTFSNLNHFHSPPILKLSNIPRVRKYMPRWITSNLFPVHRNTTKSTKCFRSIELATATKNLRTRSRVHQFLKRYEEQRSGQN